MNTYDARPDPFTERLALQRFEADTEQSEPRIYPRKKPGRPFRLVRVKDDPAIDWRVEEE